MATRKIYKSNTDSHELSKSRTLWDLVNSDTSLMYNPSNEEWRKKLAYTLLKYASEETSTNIKSFCFEWNIPYTTMVDWIAKYPDIKKAWNEAKLRIGVRRQEKAEYKVLDAKLVALSLHTYDPEWDAINQYHAALKNQEEEKNLTLVLNMAKPDITSSEELLLEVNQTQEPQS